MAVIDKFNGTLKLFKEDFHLNTELKFNFYYHPIINNFFTDEEKEIVKRFITENKNQKHILDFDNDDIE